MKAILVRYYGPGNVKGSRFIAQAEGVPRVIRSYDYSMNADGNARAVAEELASRHGWLNRHELADGELPNGDRCFVFVPKAGA